MMNRKKSIFMKSRRESVRKLSSRPGRLKDFVDDSANMYAIRQMEYLNELEKLKFNKYDIIQLSPLPMKCRNQRLVVRKEVSETMRGLKKRERNVLKPKIVKQDDEASDYRLFSSLNKDHFETGLQKPFILQKIEYNRDAEEKYLEMEKKNSKPDFDRSYSALSNWQKNMRMRRNLSDSLAQRLQRTPSSLIMNLQTDTALKNMNNSRTMELVFPYIRYGGGAGLTKSMFPEYEKTKTDLSLHREAWKPQLISSKEWVGYSKPIKSELQFGLNSKSNEPTETQMKQDEEMDILNMLDYQDIDYSDLFVGPYRVEKINTYKMQANKSSSELLNQNNKEEISSSEMLCDEIFDLGPRLRLNDSDIFERSQSVLENRSTSSSDAQVPGKSKLPGLGVIYQIAFSLCSVNEPRVVHLKFENIGSCTLKLKWKKIFQSKTYIQDLERRSFYLDIRDERLISNSSTIKTVTFKSDQSGFHDEIWEVLIGPMLYPTKIWFHFRAIALEPDRNNHSRTLILRERETFSQYNLCKTIIEDIVKYVLNKEPPEKEEEPEIETEDQKFLRLNEQLCYNYDLIQDIKAFSSETLERSWNLSLKCIKQHILDDSDDIMTVNCNLEQLMNLSQYIDTNPEYPVEKYNDHFQSWNDREDICRSLITNALDSIEFLLDKLSSKLHLGNCFKKDTEISEISETKPTDKQPTVTLKPPTEHKRRRSRKSIDRTVELQVEKRKPSVTIDIEVQKEKFHAKAEHIVFIITQQLADDLERILEV